jgi:hypothetical protein
MGVIHVVPSLWLPVTECGVENKHGIRRRGVSPLIGHKKGLASRECGGRRESLGTGPILVRLQLDRCAWNVPQISKPSFDWSRFSPVSAACRWFDSGQISDSIHGGDIRRPAVVPGEGNW